MTKIVEKPDTPISKLANIGLYYIRAVDSLWQGIDHVLASPKNKGEFFLTDAFQWMIDHGKRILTAEVGGWYDCGALGTLLETNDDPAPQGRLPADRFPRRHDPRSGLHRRRRQNRAERDRPQRVAGARRPVSDSRLRNAMVGRDAELSARRSTAPCSATTWSSRASVAARP